MGAPIEWIGNNRLSLKKKHVTEQQQKCPMRKSHDRVKNTSSPESLPLWSFTLERLSLLQSNVVSKRTEKATGYRMWVSTRSLPGTRVYQKHLQFTPQDFLTSSTEATGKAHLSGEGGIRGGGCVSVDHSSENTKQRPGDFLRPVLPYISFSFPLSFIPLHLYHKAQRRPFCFFPLLTRV